MFDSVAASGLTSAPVAPADDASAVVVTFATVLPGLPGLTGAERALMAEWITRALAALPDAPVSSPHPTIGPVGRPN